MASQYNVKPNIKESISNQEIGSFALNAWQYFELDAYYPFLMSDIVLKSGTTVISPSAYELAQDNDATAQEVGLSGKTLYGMMRVTNVSYTGITLNISGNNFGTYVSNQSTVDYVAAQIATKTGPGSDLFLAAGENAVLESASGLSLISGNSGEITAWDSGTSYTLPGTLTRLEGKTFASTGQSSNLNKDPRLPENPLYWFTPPSDDEMEKLAKDGLSCRGGMHTANDRTSGNYQQSMLIGKKAYNSIKYNFYMVHLDGTQVTGDSTLEAILKVGLSGQYAYLDKFAPDSLGTRTLIDMGEYIATPQSSGGNNDTLGEVLEDRFQGHRQRLQAAENDVNPSDYLKKASFRQAGVSENLILGSSAVNDNIVTTDFITDTTNGTPRTGLTTRPKEFTEGISYIIVMVAA